MRLTEGFNLLATAPDGIKRLRELILNLAVQGKLVPQDPNDELASVLLQKIRAEKDRMIAEGKIKKDKSLPAICDDEKPFELPEGWEWVRLPDISHNWGQETPSQQFTYIDVASVDNLRGEITEDVQVLDAADAPSRARKIVKKGTVIYSTVRPYLKNIAVIEKNYEPGAIASTAFAILHPHTGIHAQFLLTCLRCAYFTDFVSSKMIGVAYPAINDANFFQGVIPLPPLAEQSRIVAKVEELMALCDALEARGQLEDEQHARLTATLFDALAASESAHQLQENWARLAASFDLVLDRPEAIDALEQTLLQLAVRGLLVPQDPADEPACELLKQIRAEKDRLIAEGKLKKDKPMPAITDDEKPFVPPQGWEWARLGDISTLQGGFAFESGRFISGGSNQVVRMGNVRPSFLRLNENPVFIKDELAIETDAYQLLPGDIILTMTGTKNKRDYLYSCLVSENAMKGKRLYLNQRLCKVRLCQLDKVFFDLAFKDDLLLDVIFASSTGTANQANIGMKALSLWVLPIPPLAEQSRIVARVEALRALCTQLRERLATSQKIQTHLAETLVESIAYG